MSEFLQDLRANWDNSYWWADHQLLLAVLVGAVSLSFALLEVLLKQRLEQRGNDGGS